MMKASAWLAVCVFCSQSPTAGAFPGLLAATPRQQPRLSKSWCYGGGDGSYSGFWDTLAILPTGVPVHTKGCESSDVPKLRFFSAISDNLDNFTLADTRFGEYVYKTTSGWTAASWFNGTCTVGPLQLLGPIAFCFGGNDTFCRGEPDSVATVGSQTSAVFTCGLADVFFDEVYTPMGWAFTSPSDATVLYTPSAGVYFNVSSTPFTDDRHWVLPSYCHLD